VVARPLRRKESEFRHLYEARRPRYLQAHIRVETGGKSVADVVREIAFALKLEIPGEEK
jgi:shikimate kinase